jgi:hypothetical protein
VAAAQHPSYSNPVITEAVCEVQFELSEDNPWKASMFGDFYKRTRRKKASRAPYARHSRLVRRHEGEGGGEGDLRADGGSSAGVR